MPSLAHVTTVVNGLPPPILSLTIVSCRVTILNGRSHSLTGNWFTFEEIILWRNRMRPFGSKQRV